MKTIKDLEQEASTRFSERFKHLQGGNPNYTRVTTHDIADCSVDDVFTSNSDLELLGAVLDLTPFEVLSEKLRSHLIQAVLNSHEAQFGSVGAYDL